MKYLFVALLFLGVVACKKKEVEHEPVAGLLEINSITQINTEVSNGVSFIFFHASWCSVCQAQRPAVSEVAVDHDLSSVFFGEVEYDNYPDIIEAYNISGFPTMVIYVDGNEVDRINGGGNSAASLKSKIQEHL